MRGENYRHIQANCTHNSEMFIIKFQWSQFHSIKRLCIEIMKEQGWKGAWNKSQQV